MKVVTEYALDLSEFYEKMEQAGKTYAAFDEHIKQSMRKNPVAEFAVKQGEFNKRLGEQVLLYQRNQAAATSFRNEQKRLEAQYKDLNARKLEFLAAGRYGELKTLIGQVRDKLKEMNSPLVETNSLWDKLKAKLSAGLKIPKIEVPTPETPETPKTKTPSAGRTEKGKGFLGQAGEAALDQVGGAAGLNLSGGTLAAGAAVGAVAATVLKGTKEWAEYGEKLSEVSALTGATGKDLKYLDDQAQQIEKDTGIAGVTILEAFKNIAGIKPELLENNEALAQTTKEVIALSQASKLSLDDSARALLGSLSQFNEGADQAARFANVLAAGAQKGNSEINDTAEALKNSGTAMKAAGLSFEQGNSLLQILAKGMIKGSEAGTALRNILLKLETQSDKNLRPSIVGLDKALENASKKFNTTSEQAKVFGVENIVAAKQILSARTEVSEMTKALTGTSTAYEQAKTNTDNLATDLKKAGTAVDAFFRNLGQSNDGFLRGMVQRFSSAVNEIGSKTGVLKTFISSYVKNDQDGLIGALGTAYRDANKQRQANLDKARKDARNTGIMTASTQSVQDDLKIITTLNQQRGEVESTAIRNAAAKVKKQRDEAYQESVADHLRLRKELEKEIKETGRDSGRLNKEFQQSRDRVLSTTTAKKLADSTVARLKKEADDQAENLAKLLGEPASGAKTKANKKAQEIQDESNRILLEGQQKYVEEYQKLESEFGKERLEALQKDGAEYINTKAELDQKALKIERDAFERRLQIAAAERTEVVNGKRQAVPNTSITLEKALPDFARAFSEKQQQIEDARVRELALSRVRQEYQLLELAKKSNDNELAVFDAYWKEKLLVESKNAATYVSLEKQRDEARKVIAATESDEEVAAFDEAWKKILANEAGNAKVYLAMVAKRNRDRNALVVDQILKTTREQQEIETSFTDTNRYGDQLRQQDPSLNADDLLQKREEAKLAIRIKFGEQTIALLKEQGESENALLITQTQAAVDALKQQQNELKNNTPKFRDIYDLLGLTDGMNAEQLNAFRQGLQQIGQAVQDVTAIIVEESNKKIQALDNEIQAKQEQVRIEEERNKEGYANNLALRRAELEDLKRQKAEEEATRRKALKVQQTLDAASTISNATVAVSNGINFLTNLSAQMIKLGPIAGPIAFFAVLATMTGAIFATVTKLKALTQLRKGGRIPLDGRTHERGGHRIEGTDIEVERGEHVTNAQSSEQYDETLEAINQNDPRKALQALFREGNFGLPAIVIQHLQHPDFNRPQPAVDVSALARKIDQTNERLDTLIGHTAEIPKSTTVGLGDGRVIEKKGNQTTITDHGKRK